MLQRTVWVLRHHPNEALGIISRAFHSAGVLTKHINLFQGEPVPRTADEAAGIIAMGWPMSMHDPRGYPFLTDEMHLIQRALVAEKPVLAISFGCQLLASTLGAVVTRGQRKEIGWHSVTLTEEAKSDTLWAGLGPSFTAFHWHSDVFTLPGGAVSLAFSDLTEHQAFRYGHNAYGFLFHMEVTHQIILNIVNAFAHELREARADGREIVNKAQNYLRPLNQVGETVYRRWAQLIPAEDA